MESAAYGLDVLTLPILSCNLVVMSSYRGEISVLTVYYTDAALGTFYGLTLEYSSQQAYEIGSIIIHILL